jgi:hypothetical protein
MVRLPTQLGELPVESGEARALNDSGQVVGTIVTIDQGGEIFTAHAVRWTVRPGAGSAPVVDHLAAVALPPGILTGEDGQPLSGVWLRVRLRDPGDSGPWTWVIQWGDGGLTTLQDLPRAGEFAFLRPDGFRTPGPHTIIVTTIDQGGLTSAPATTTVP